MEIDEHIGCAMSGLIADARTLVERTFLGYIHIHIYLHVWELSLLI